MISYSSDYVDEPLKARLEKENTRDHFSDKKLGYKSLKGATVLPARVAKDGWRVGGGIISENGYEENSAGRGREEFGFSYDYDKEKVRYVDETVVYIGMFERVWGHCITDNLALLWFLKSELLNKYRGCKIIYLSPTEGLASNFNVLLSLLNIDIKNCERVTSPTKYKEIILPERCFFAVDRVIYFTKEFRALINEALSKVPAADNSAYEKIYFTRARFTKNDVGEKKLEKFFKRHGYTVVSPEKFTFSQQIAMLKRCKSLAATEGSVSHNSVFMNEGSEVLLLNRADYITPYSLALNQVNNVRATFISVNLSVMTNVSVPVVGPNFYYVSDHLLKYFGEEARLNKPRYWVENFKDLKKYFKQWVWISSVGERISQPYYYEKLQTCLQKYDFMRKRTFPYCFLRIKAIPIRIQNYIRQKRK